MSTIIKTIKLDAIIKFNKIANLKIEFHKKSSTMQQLGRFLIFVEQSLLHRGRKQFSTISGVFFFIFSDGAVNLDERRDQTGLEVYYPFASLSQTL